MIHDQEGRLSALRDQFVELCVTRAPKRLREVRQGDAPGEFDDLCGDFRTALIAVSGSCLFIATRALAFQTPDRALRRVGDFAIRIDAHTREIKALGSMPKKGQHNEANHPHVQGNGSPCFGEDARQQLALWFGDGMFAHVGFYMLEFLCIARGESDYVPHTMWPHLTKEEETEWRRLQTEACGSSRHTSSTRPLSTSSASAPAAPRRRWF